MTEPDSRIKVAILAVPEVTASTLFDLFYSPGRDFAFITTGEAGPQRMLPFVVSLDGREFQAANGVWVRPDFSLTDCPRPDIVCIPDFYVDPSRSVAGLHNAEARWLKHAHGEGAMLASACSGALLIGEAGLLSNCEATIHWGYVASLSQELSRREGEGPAIIGVEWGSSAHRDGRRGFELAGFGALSHRPLCRTEGGDGSREGLCPAVA